MTLYCCDLCEQPLRGSYTDENGKIWDDISFQEKRYKRRICFMTDTWTEYLSICGYCRAEIANRRKVEDKDGEQE